MGISYCICKSQIVLRHIEQFNVMLTWGVTEAISFRCEGSQKKSNVLMRHIIIVLKMESLTQMSAEL